MKSIYSLSILIIFHFISSNKIQAQGENDHWIFGNSCHVSFKNGSPQVLAPLNTLKTFEGCSSVSDKYGNLLFYSDGITVWNKNHAIMQNGTGLKGDPSSTSSCVVVPFPKHPNMYYMFCVQSNMSYTHLLTYNIVDLSANSGLGKIVSKNNILETYSDEKIAVTKNCSSQGYWILVHRAKSNLYLSFSLDSTGIKATPKTSIQDISSSQSIEIGYLKFSSDGNFLANAQCHGRTIELYKFDKKTGLLKYIAHETIAMGRDQTFYGLSFSPNNTFLYASYLDQGLVYQYNLKQSPGSIFKNGILVMKGSSRIGSLQLGKDKKLYATNSYNTNSLNCILNPEELGTDCQAVLNYLTLNTTCHIGLPTYVESLDNYFTLGRDSVIDYHKYTLSANYKNAEYLWSTGQKTESIIIDRSGTYWLTIIDPQKCILIRDTITIDLMRFGADMKALAFDTLSVCSGTKISLPKFESDSPNIRYFWTNNNPNIGLAQSGWGQIADFKAPFTREIETAKITIYPKSDTARGKPKTFHLTIKPKIKLDSIPSFTICAGDSLPDLYFTCNVNQFKTDWTNNNYGIGLSSNGSGYFPKFVSQLNANDKSAKIKVIGTNEYCSSDTTEFEINIIGLPSIALVDDQQFCGDQILEKINFKSQTKNAAINWTNNNTKIGLPDTGTTFIRQQKLLNPDKDQSSLITVIAVNGKCKSKAMSFKIELKSKPLIESVKAFSYCSGDSMKSVRFIVTKQFEKLEWNNDNIRSGIPKSGATLLPSMKLPILNSTEISTIEAIAYNKQCQSEPISFDIRSIAKPQLNNSKQEEICSGDNTQEITLHSSPASSNISWTYQDSFMGEFKTGNKIIPSIPTIASQSTKHHKIIIQAEYETCKSDTMWLDLKINPKPIAKFEILKSETVYGKLQNELSTINKSEGGSYYLWNWGDQEISEEFQPKHNYNTNNENLITLYVENEYGCSDTASIRIEFTNQIQYNIPNAFSPDKNGKNEVFHIYGLTNESASFEIFNRWGKKLFETYGNKAWDGTYKDKDCQADVYIYKAKIVSKEGKLIELSGTVSLLR